MGRVLGDQSVQSAVLEDLSSAVRYRRWLASLATPHLGAHPIEVGSGTGDYAEEWAPHCTQFTCSEADGRRLEALRRRFRGRPDVAVRKLSVPLDETGSYSAAVAYNVMEHVPDHVGALRGMARLIAPDGRVVVLVPAFQFAMSRFDREIGHQRRYTRRSLHTALTAAGLDVVELRYINAVGLVAWLLVMKVLRRRPGAGRLLTAYDRLVIPLVSRLERRWGPPAGQSVFAVARLARPIS